jgi:hypothetical protein
MEPDLYPAPPAAPQRNVGDLLTNPSFIVKFNDKYIHMKAGMPSNELENIHVEYGAEIPEGANNVWAPFISKMDWEIARWAKLRGPSSTAFTELLNIDGVGVNTYNWQ